MPLAGAVYRREGGQDLEVATAAAMVVVAVVVVEEEEEEREVAASTRQVCQAAGHKDH